MKSKAGTDTEFFRTEKIPKILLQIAPPVMLAQLIQAMYNIVDSFFVGKYSEPALTALSVIYPLQLIIIALAVGTGVGVNTYMARLYAQKMPGQAEETAGTGTLLALGTWFIFAIFSIFCMRPYVLTSANTPEAIESAVIYGQIVCIGSIGAFLEGNWTKVHQSRGNMHRPMVAQTVGALTNIMLDPILIFGLGPVPELGVAGAAYATVCGQVAAAVITSFGGVGRLPERTKMPLYIKQIYWFGYASIIMQALFTVYIVILRYSGGSSAVPAGLFVGLRFCSCTIFFLPCSLIGLESKIPLGLLIFSSILNIVMDLWMVAGLGLGVFGAALATLIAQGISAVFSLLIFFYRMRRYKSIFAWFDGQELRSMLRIAVPSVLQQSTVSIGMMIVQAVVNPFGTQALAGYAATMRVENVFSLIFVSIGNAVSPFVSQNLGANKTQRIKKGYHAALVLDVCFAALAFLVIETLHTQISSLFLGKDGTALAYQVSGDYMRWLGYFFYFYGN